MCVITPFPIVELNSIILIRKIIESMFQVGQSTISQLWHDEIIINLSSIFVKSTTKKTLTWSKWSFKKRALQL